MAYEKLTLEGFKAKLNTKYITVGAANQALGRSTFSNKEKAEAREAIAKAFPENGKSAKVKVTKVVAVVREKRKYTKKAKPDDTSKAPIEEPKEQEKLDVKKITKKTRVTKAKDTELFNSTKQQLERISLAKERVGTVTQAIMAMIEAKKMQPELNINAGIQISQQTLTGVIEGVREDMLKSSDISEEEVVKKLSETANAVAAGAVGLNFEQPV